MIRGREHELRSNSNVRFDQLGGVRNVTVEGGFHHRPMFILVGTRRRPIGRRYLSIAFTFLEKRAPDLEQRRRIAAGGERIMKLAVQLAPGLAQLVALAMPRLFAVHAMVRREQAGFPILVAALNRKSYRFHFDHDAQIGNVGQVFRRDGGNSEPVLTFDFH